MVFQPAIFTSLPDILLKFCNHILPGIVWCVSATLRSSVMANYLLLYWICESMWGYSNASITAERRLAVYPTIDSPSEDRLDLVKLADSDKYLMFTILVGPDFHGDHQQE
jgi:hypothetical protein